MATANASESSVQIIPFYSQPHVHTVIDDDTWYDETVNQVTVSSDDKPFSTAVVTGADTGIDNMFVRMNDLGTKKALFGDSNFIKYGQSSIQADVLFDGNTNVWFMRVLPDNAKYANLIFLAHYRKGKILNDLGQETGKSRLEIKFSTVSMTPAIMQNGALTDAQIRQYAESLVSAAADSQTGYLTVPIAYVRSIGRGKYGNNYSMSITRDISAEKEYGVKMYKFNLLDNTDVTRVIKQFAGSLVMSSYKKCSTMISDVLDVYALGSCPVHIESFEDHVLEIFDYYKNTIVAENEAYVAGSGYNPMDVDELNAAKAIEFDTFDPLFGLVQGTQTDELIPYYQNYTVTEAGMWEAPDLEVPVTQPAPPTDGIEDAGEEDLDGNVIRPPANIPQSFKPLNISEWASCYVGARVLLAADALHDGYRWMYTVVSIDAESGNITYDEGYAVDFDAEQYDGVNISVDAGITFEGGHDGDFQEITVKGITRAPNAAEMKLLLSREYVKAFKGLKDRRILSPARIDYDVLYDANYNLSSDETLEVSTNTAYLYNHSTVLTDKDAMQLAVLAESTGSLTFEDLNVKKAMYELNNFRNRNGMTKYDETTQVGAGGSLYLDCGLVGLSTMFDTDVNTELDDIIKMMAGFQNRQTSIDLGYYEIFDPTSNRRIQVTATYFIAKNLTTHLITYGLNKPFASKYARLTSIQKTVSAVVAGEMIRDTFAPDIDLIDWDVKEALYKSRINYYITSEEGRVVERAVQNTRQMDASALLEENNVRVLNRLKKGMEKACRGYLYEWNEPEVRKSYTQAQMQIYRPWIGTFVEDLDIQFRANEWETDRMIMHCYVVVKFKNIVKRIILEINIQKPDYRAD